MGCIGREMIRRIIIFFVIICLIGSNCLCFNQKDVLAAATESNDEYDNFEYKVQDDGTIEIVSYIGSEDTVTIPSFLEGRKVTRISSIRYAKLVPSIKSVIIPETIEEIGDNAFADCFFLKSITISPGVKTIGNGAFFDCFRLSSITIPNSVSVIGAGAFQACESLESVKILNNDVEIRSSAFCQCYNLTSVTIPNKLKTIPTGMFSYCTSLKAIEIPDGVIEIDSWAFEGCTNLESVVIPESVSIIGSSAFKGCASLKKITVPDGVKEIQQQAFSSCTGLTEFKIPSGVKRVNEKTFINCLNLERIVIPDSVSAIDDEAFSGCIHLVEVNIPDSVVHINDYAFGYCENLSKITIGYVDAWISDTAFYGCKQLHIVYADEQEDDDHNDNTKDSEETVDSKYQEARDIYISAKLYQKESGLGEIKLHCDETKFNDSSSTYNHDLAQFAIGLSTMVYNEDKNEYGGLNTYIEDMMVEIGCDPDSIVYVQDDTGDTAPYLLANKTIILNGKKTHVLYVIIRGTYKAEWIDNFDPGYGEAVHKGFLRGAKYVYGGMSDYIRENNLDDTDLKVLITGHSRGAAVANLLGGLIDDNISTGVGSFKTMKKDDVFVYSFATPNTTTDKSRDKDKYNNIFSIVNPEDFVTKVMPSKWGFGRYGTTYVLPSKSTDSLGLPGDYVSYGDYLLGVQDYYERYRPKDKDGYAPYIRGMKDVSVYVDRITSIVLDSNEYYTKDLNIGTDLGNTRTPFSLQSLFTKTLGYFMSGDSVKQISSFSHMIDATTGLYWGYIGQKTIEYFFLHQMTGAVPVLTESFACAHRAETYLAAMNVITESEIKQPRKTMKGIVNCPVDVVVRDSSGDIVGEIHDNQVENVNSDEITMDVNGDSKVFYLPSIAEYSVELIGNDNGKMDYSLCEIDADKGEVGRTVFLSVDVKEGYKFNYVLGDNNDYKDSYLVSDSGDEISPSVTYEDASEGVDINVDVEGIGYVDSYSNVKLGEYVTLKAVTDENNTFLGYYNKNGELISSLDEYSFSVSNDESFIAKFTNNKVDVSSVSFDKSSIDMIIGEQTLCSATVSPSNATNKWLKYSSNNKDVVSVTDDGIVEALSEGDAVIMASTIDGKCEAQLNVHVVNQGNDDKEEINSPTSISIKNKKTYKKSKKVTIKDEDGIKTIKLNKKKIKGNGRFKVKFKLSKYKKYLKKKGKWNKLVVNDMLGNKKSIKFKTK